MKGLTIGVVARQAGVGVETIRYYERQGLLQTPDRTTPGFHRYDEATVTTLQFIRRAKELGFTLKEIKGLLALQRDGSATSGDVRQQATEKVADIEARIADLQRMRESLLKLIQKCCGTGAVSGCPIILALQGAKQD